MTQERNFDGSSYDSAEESKMLQCGQLWIRTAYMYNNLEKKKNVVFLKRLEQAGEALKLGVNEKEMLKMNEEDNEELEEAYC